jgi:hypothetical protein
VDFVMLAVLAALGLGTVLIFAVKALLDLLPDLFTSWQRAVASLRSSLQDEPDRAAPERAEIVRPSAPQEAPGHLDAAGREAEPPAKSSSA